MWTCKHTGMSPKSKNWLVQMKGCGSFPGQKWMWQSVTKNWAGLINTAAVSVRRPDWHIKAWKTQGTADISNKKKHNLHPSYIFTNFTPHSALTIWVEWSHTQWGRKALKKVFICVLLATQTDRRDHLSLDSLKEKRKAGGGGWKKRKIRSTWWFFFFHEVLSVPTIPLSAFH